MFTVYIHIKKMVCDTILEIKAKPSPEAVIISVPFAPEGKVKVSVNLLINNSFLLFFSFKMN